MSLSTAIKLLDEGEIKAAKKVLRNMKIRQADYQKTHRDKKNKTQKK
jgi:hypothetical protein